MVLLCVAGALSTLALAPFFYVPLLWITIPIFIMLIRTAERARQGFWYGWWFGFGYFCAGIYWFAHALLVDAAAFGWLIPFAVLGIGAGLAIYIGLNGWIGYYARNLPVVPFSLAFALLWTAMEVVRSLLLTGFPWNLIGYSWAAHDIAIQVGSIGGIWWLSLLTMILAALPLWLHPAPKTSLLTLAGFTCLLVWGAWRLETHPTSFREDVTLRIVQAAIPQDLKWDEAKRLEAHNKHLQLSMSAGHEDVTHIIWPESAMTFRFEPGDFWTRELAYVAPKGGALITGVVRAEPPVMPGAPPRLYNSLKSVTHDAAIDTVYDKRKLVPFGEYVPFRSVLPLEKITHGSLDFTAGSHTGSLQTAGAPPFRPLICYEAIFPALSQDSHPDWLLNITNDGWFGDSTGPYQHFHMARMRAVEQGVPLVRAANTGISAIIDPYGRRIASLGLGTSGVLDANLPYPAPQRTLYGYYGHWVLGYTVIVLLMLIGYTTLHTRRIHDPNS